MKTIQAANRALIKFIDGVGLICSILVLLMILNVFYDVLMRYLFNNVSIGMQELEWHLFAAMFMFGIGYTMKEDGHVRVDVFYDRFKPKAQAKINLLGSIFFTIPFACLIAYYGFGYALDAYEMGEGSGDPGGLPHRWVVRSFICSSSVFLLICTVQVCLKCIIELKQPTDSAEA